MALGRAGQCLDACLDHLELADAGRAASETAFALDHMGALLGIGPYAGKRERVLAVWRRGTIEVARCENVVVKLGGIGMPIFGHDWHHRDVEPSSVALAEAWGGEMRWCIDQFVVERCMFESNFPDDKRSCSYLVLWNALKRITAGASASDNATLFYDNAEKIYCLRFAVSSGGAA